MRILHVLDHSIPIHSGYTFRTRAILEQQRALGWETCHVTSPKHRGDGKPKEQVGSFEFYRTPPLRPWQEKLSVISPWWVMRALERRLEELIPVLRPDIVHAHSPALNGLAALRVARRHGLPLVYECRAFWEDAAVDHGTTVEGGPRYRLTRALETYVFRHADAVTTICEGLKSDIVARGISEAKVTVIPNAVDVDQFEYGALPNPELKRRLNLNGRTVLGFIGSFYAYEGLALLLEAMPRIVEKHQNLRLLLVGGGPQEPALKALHRRLSLEDRVIFAGRVPHDRVQEYYDLVDVFVYPRLPMRLTELVTPLKPLEAMARGRLVIASDVGGHRELIRDRETGLLFQAGSAKALADKVIEALEKRSEWPGLIASARRYVETERNWRISVVRYSDVYQSIKQVARYGHT